MKLGFSTGCLYKLELPWAEVISHIKATGANSIELMIARSETLLKLDVDEIAKLTSGFKHVSVHSPVKDMHYRDDERTKTIIAKLKEISDALPAKPNIVIHPHRVGDFRVLQESGLNFLIENMETSEKYGDDLEFFKRMKDKFNFILDTQHALKIDSTLKLGRDLLDIMGVKLKQFHVSGIVNGTHGLMLLDQERAKQQLHLIKDLDVPIIIESMTLEPDKLGDEYDFVKSFFKMHRNL
ncbi:hypothetical protein ACFL1B_01695 [Nanoarchaeota archaeon]